MVRIMLLFLTAPTEIEWENIPKRKAGCEKHEQRISAPRTKHKPKPPPAHARKTLVPLALITTTTTTTYSSSTA